MAYKNDSDQVSINYLALFFILIKNIFTTVLTDDIFQVDGILKRNYTNDIILFIQRSKLISRRNKT